MKKHILLTFVGILLSICTFSHEKYTQDFFYKQLPEDNNRWEKTKEQIEEKGFYHLEFAAKEDLSKKIIITFEARKEEPNLIQRRSADAQDLFSLLEKEDPSALHRMKELRLELKKTDSPYSDWKLLYVVSENDIIYEYTIPDLGLHQARYEMTRLIKRPDGYLKITYQNSKEPFKEASLFWFKWLKEL